MKKLMCAFLVLLAVNVADLGYTLEEEWQPYQFSFFYPVQVLDEFTSVKGVRYNFLYGLNKNVKGLDFGVINQVSNEQSGLQLGFINNSFKTSGVQFGIINKTDFLDGIQIGILNFHTEGNYKLLPIVNWSF